jgi:hypothetical protein
MNHKLCSLVALVCIALPLASGLARAQMPPAPGEPASPRRAAMGSHERYLDAWLGYLSRQARGQRKTRSVLDLIGGGLLGLAGTLDLRGVDSDRGDKRTHWDGGTVLEIGVGTALIVQGAVSLALQSNEEVRFVRWQSLSEGRDPRVVAHFEGELEATAHADRLGTISLGIVFIGVAATGAVLLAAAPETSDRDARVARYVGGGILLAFGVWQAIVDFTSESQGERNYRLYRAGLAPQHSSWRLRVAPVVAAHGGGIAIAGTL